MKFHPTTLKGSYIVELEPYSDERGWFARTYCKNEFSQIGHVKEWVQLNHSFTVSKGTIRGMHFQYPPFSEIKMVRCIAGTVFDVIIDIREESPTFMQWYGVELSPLNKKMIYIPQGFAHGFQAMTENCELIYHHSSFYTPGHEGGVLYNDKLLNIEWPETLTEISARDLSYESLTNSFKGIKL